MTDIELARIRRARDDIKHHIHTIVQRIEQNAEGKVKASRRLPDTFGRSTTSWSTRHEEVYATYRCDGLAQHSQELGALRAKLVRQQDAIAARLIKKSRRPAQC